jgi:hypothetical protein
MAVKGTEGKNSPFKNSANDEAQNITNRTANMNIHDNIPTIVITPAPGPWATKE